MTVHPDIARNPAHAAIAGQPSLARRTIVMVQTQAEGAGAQEVSRILGNGFAARGMDVHHVFLFRRTAAFDAQPNTFFCACSRPANLVAVVRMFVRLVRHLRALRPDAVLAFQHYGNMIGALAARIAGVRVVIANRTSTRRQIPVWLDAIDMLAGCLGLYSRVIVNSGPVEEEYRSYPQGYQKRVRRIDHAFEAKTTPLGRADARQALKLPLETTLIGSVARLHPDKRLDVAIRLLANHPDWHAAFAGQGPHGAELEALAQSLGVRDRVHFIGELPPDWVGAFLKSLDVFVFPSAAETFGLAVVEAAQAGAPVVANDLDILHEVLAVGGQPCALFADTGDLKAFGAAVTRLLEDDALRRALTERGQALSQRYSLDSMVAPYAALIEATLGGHEYTR